MTGTPPQMIFLSATMPDTIEEQVKEYGADGYIIKPFETEELLNKVKNILN